MLNSCTQSVLCFSEQKYLNRKRWNAERPRSHSKQTAPAIFIRLSKQNVTLASTITLVTIVTLRESDARAGDQYQNL
jgi:hypothetical protein